MPRQHRKASTQDRSPIICSMHNVQANFWSLDASQVLRELGTSPEGLSRSDVEERRQRYGPNLIERRPSRDVFTLVWSQFKSPITIILAVTAVLSFFFQQPTNGAIILGIVIVSGFLGFWQEYGAVNAMKALVSLIQTTVRVRRDGHPAEITAEEVVPGDIVSLTPGDLVPGDCLILQSQDLFVDEAALTGETYPAEKTAGILPPETPLKERKNVLFMGTHAVSGTATAVVVHTARATEFGKIAQRLELRRPETEFERGVRRFGYLLMEITLILVVAIFAINAFLARPILDSFLFSLALAVGLTPQLLPAIISVNLSQGAKMMAKARVIVKRLASIENFGSMNVLCSDKTGTLTAGRPQIQAALDYAGSPNQKAHLYAYLNATFETGYVNPIDDALRTQQQFDVSGYSKLDEIPYDFIRKRVSILVSNGGKDTLIVKGALPDVLAVSRWAESADGKRSELDGVRPQIDAQFTALSSQGLRTLGIGYRDIGAMTISRSDERDLIFLGFLVFHDPVKEGIVTTIEELGRLGLSLKIITGDNKLVAMAVAEKVGLSSEKLITGSELHHLSDEALSRIAGQAHVFAEIEPNQKERIIRALMRANNVVGFLGDGINDASALHVADVGISVDSAVDVAKEAADIVLLEKDISVLVEGIREGRKTFANTLKYVFMATSANFGNMFSMAGASIFLPFLPLLPGQILLNNLMTDLPEMTIATDSVDSELVERPRRWNISFIRRFMVVFGILSSVFDYLTFGALLLLLHADAAMFRTGWFIESVMSASLVVLVIRSRRLFFSSRPSPSLLIMTLAVSAAAMAIPFTPLGMPLQFISPPLSFIAIMLLIVVLYILSAEIVKKVFYRLVPM